MVGRENDYDNANDEQSSDENVWADVEEENRMDSGDGAWVWLGLFGLSALHRSKCTGRWDYQVPRPVHLIPCLYIELIIATYKILYVIPIQFEWLLCVVSDLIQSDFRAQ